MQENKLDDGFLDWFAGFVAGEGCFTITANPGCRQFYPRLVIGLRNDDIDILIEIQERLGMGTIYCKTWDSERSETVQPSAAWTVQATAETRRLVEILDAHPLRAKKQRDYEIWRQAVMENRKSAQVRDLAKMRYLADRIKLVRQYNSEVQVAPRKPEMVQLGLPGQEQIF